MDAENALSECLTTYVAAFAERCAKRVDREWPIPWKSSPVRAEYQNLVRYVKAFPGSSSRFDDEMLESFIDEALKALISKNEPIDGVSRRLAEQLAFAISTRLIVPLNGVDIVGQSLSIGSLTLIKMDMPTFESLVVAPFAEPMSTNELYTEADRAGWISQQRAELESFIGTVCAEITAASDIGRTFEYGIAIAVNALCDLLQFVASTELPYDKRFKVEWATDARRQFRRAFMFSNDSSRRTLRHVEVASVLFPLTIDDDTISNIEKWGLTRLVDSAALESPSEFVDMLQRAIRWFAKGEREEHDDDRKLSYVTAVDLFFSEAGPGATRRICIGFAFALAPDDKSIPGLARYMFKIFRSRSITSHAGQLGVMSEDDLKSLRYNVQQFILSMASRAFADRSAISAWIASRQASLDPGIARKLQLATDWRYIRDEEKLMRIYAVLRRTAEFVDAPSDGYYLMLALASTIIESTRDMSDAALDLRKKLSVLDQPLDAVVKAFHDGEVNSDAALTFATVLHEQFSDFPWFKDSIEVKLRAGIFSF
jgi:hypothetical protein